MNKLTYTLITLLALLVLSCSKDSEITEDNSIKMDNDSFLISGATMLGISIEDDGHTGITLISGNQSTVKTITIDVESFTQETIEGYYTYPQTAESKKLDDFLTYYMITDGSSSTSSNLESGNVTVKHISGSNYSITMDLMMQDGITFKGTYSGDFTIMFSNN